MSQQGNSQVATVSLIGCVTGIRRLIVLLIRRYRGLRLMVTVRRGGLRRRGCLQRLSVGVVPRPRDGRRLMRYGSCCGRCSSGRDLCSLLSVGVSCICGVIILRLCLWWHCRLWNWLRRLNGLNSRLSRRQMCMLTVVVRLSVSGRVGVGILIGSVGICRSGGCCGDSCSRRRRHLRN